MLALPIFPARLQTSIFGRSELNFRVRNGNGWTLAVIDTNYLHSAVSSQATLFLSPKCVLRTLRGGTPSGTRTLDTLIKSQVLYQLS